MTKILFLEDEPTILEVTLEYLQLENYEVKTATDGNIAIHLLKEETFDLAILDIMVPYVSGLEILDYIHENHPNMNAIMLTALGDEQTQIQAFNSYADDYIVKPFSPILLIKRIEVILRRKKKASPNVSGLSLNQEGYQVYYDGKDVGLTLTEYLIFETLYNRPSQVYTRDQLLNTVLSDNYYVSDRTIDVHIKNLRKKIPLNCIKTVIGVGYQYQEVL